MPGRATKAQLRTDDGAGVRVATPNADALRVLDARVAEPADNQAALRALEAKQPPAANGIREQAAAFERLLHQELHSLAGGQAPTSVMLLSDLAMSAVIAVQMQRFMTYGSFGRWSEHHLSDSEFESKRRDSAEKSQRNLAGLSVVARDMLAAVRAAAVEAGKQSKGSATDQLFAAIGVSGEGADGLPDHTPRTVSSGSLGASIAAPPVPPVPGGSK